MMVPAGVRSAKQSGLLGSLVTAASTTAWGDARPLDVALADIAESTTAGIVELSIGAFPVGNPDEVLDAHRDRFAYIGHHAMPVGVGRMIRPHVDAEREVAEVCERVGLSRYTGHAPNRRQVDAAGFYRWAGAYWETLGAVGVDFAVETMYVPQVRDEAVKSGGYHLSSPGEVFDFAMWAEGQGWDRPLLVDVSHLHIGWRSGLWTEADIVELLESRWVAELHLSENDGRTDSHRPLTAGHIVHDWVARADVSCIPLVVDEGRRRQRRSRHSGR
jgi:hypothetical protein